MGIQEDALKYRRLREKKNEYQRKYRLRPHVRAKEKVRAQSTESRAKQLAYRQRPEVKARMRAYFQRPDIKAKMQAYRKQIKIAFKLFRENKNKSMKSSPK